MYPFGTPWLSLSASYTCLLAVIGSPKWWYSDMFHGVGTAIHGNPKLLVIYFIENDFYIWTNSRLRTLSLVHPGASANGLIMQPQSSLQPPSMYWCAIRPLAAWTYMLDHTWMGACVHISLTGLLLMCLHSGAAEHLRKVPHCQMLLLVSGSYLRFILSTLCWIVEKDQKTGLITF